MPEGDTVHKIAGYLRARIAGERIDAGSVRHRPDIRLSGRRIEEVFARGKHLFLALDDGTLLRSHLGMHGSWHRYPEGQPWRRPANQASIELRVRGQVYVCFRAQEVEHLRAGSVREREIATRLGPDLLAPEVDLGSIVERLGQLLDPGDREYVVCDLLLDQRVAAGIGNVYKSEVLFLERTHPGNPAVDVELQRLRQVYQTARDLLLRNLGPGPRTTWFASGAVLGGRALPHSARGGYWVYNRRGLPCFACGATIEQARLGQIPRATYWCPRCQPATGT